MSNNERSETEIHQDKPLLCRLGLHKWSENRGGIKVCRRAGCRKAKTFGISGAMRRLQFEEELYETYRQHEAPPATAGRRVGSDGGGKQ